jgi:hypothetical protein
VTARGSEALGTPWLRAVGAWPDALALDPAELAALAVRCPTLEILGAALPDVAALGPAVWAATAFDFVPGDARAELDEYVGLHEWLLLHVILDGETQLPEGPGATALLRAAYDPDAGVLRFGGRGR